MGVKIEELNKLISFKAKRWLAPYIDQNTEQRARTDDPSKRYFGKLLKRTLYAKTTKNEGKKTSKTYK